MRKIVFVLTLIIAVIASQAVFAQEKPVEKKAEKVVKMNKAKCPKNKKCCDKCEGKKCDGKCCAKCAAKCEKGKKGQCVADSTAKCKKQNIEKPKINKLN